MVGPCKTAEVVCKDADWFCSYPPGVEVDRVDGLSEEVCDDFDGNCDGSIDEGLLNTCGSCGPQPQEICDGIDNDCDCPRWINKGDTNFDGIECGVGDLGVDEVEDIYKDWTISDRVCYSGNPIESIGYPPCRAGLITCVAGETICLNEVIPVPEFCDGIDNDCNGKVDDADGKKYDLLFVFDTSGSMGSEIRAVADACFEYITQYSGNPNIRFAVAIMTNKEGGPPDDVWRNLVKVIVDFSDIVVAQSAMADLKARDLGLEASLDSLYLGCDRDNSLIGSSAPGGLSWRDDAVGLIFAFTDEPAQTYLLEDRVTWNGVWKGGETTGQDVIDSCLTNDVVPYVWSRHPAFFDYIVQGAGGKHFPLTGNKGLVLNDLNSIIVKLCE